MSDPRSRRHLGALATRPRTGVFSEDFAMTVEIFYLTAQLQRWLNMRVARHLAAQAEKLTR